jgi:hypothetical protein
MVLLVLWKRKTLEEEGGRRGFISSLEVDVKASCGEDNSEAQRAHLWKWADGEGNVTYQTLVLQGE